MSTDKVIEDNLKEVNALVDQMIRKTFADKNDYLEKVVQAKELKGLASTQLGNLATLLNNATFQEYAVKYGGEGTRALNILASVIKNLPEGASITLNGVTLSAATLDGVKSAESLPELCTALANIISNNGLKTLSVNSFANGMPITVQYNSRTFTFVLAVEIAD